MSCSASGYDRGDALGANLAAVAVVAVAPVGVDPMWWLPGSAAGPSDRWDLVDQGMSWVTSWRLPPVRAVARGAARVGDDVVFRAGLAAVNRARTGLGRPLSARAWEPSFTARDTSGVAVPARRTGWPQRFDLGPRLVGDDPRRLLTPPHVQTGRSSRPLGPARPHRVGSGLDSAAWLRRRVMVGAVRGRRGGRPAGLRSVRCVPKEFVAPLELGGSSTYIDSCPVLTGNAVGPQALAMICPGRSGVNCYRHDH